MEIVKQNLAEQDLVDIWLYSFRNWGEAHADMYLEKLDAALSLLKENPEMGQKCLEPLALYSKVLVGSHFIYYRLEAREIVAVRVLGQEMDVA